MRTRVDSRTVRSSAPWLVSTAEVITVGLPFCVFKLLSGMLAIAAPAWAPIGWLLLAMGTADAIMNAANLIALPVARRRVAGICVLDVSLRRLSARHGGDLGLALDVFVSFALVAIAVGFGLLAMLPPWGLAAWNAAVVLNVLGAGTGRLVGALRARTG
jgi:hypothetical protein